LPDGRMIWVCLRDSLLGKFLVNADNCRERTRRRLVSVMLLTLLLQF